MLLGWEESVNVNVDRIRRGEEMEGTCDCGNGGWIENVASFDHTTCEPYSRLFNLSTRPEPKAPFGAGKKSESKQVFFIKKNILYIFSKFCFQFLLIGLSNQLVMSQVKDEILDENNFELNFIYFLIRYVFHY